MLNNYVPPKTELTVYVTKKKKTELTVYVTKKKKKTEFYSM